MATLEAELLDGGPDGLGDPQPVEREERTQGVVPRRGHAGGDEEGSELVTVEADGVGLVVESWPPHVGGR
jgi:hypothetical protein